IGPKEGFDQATVVMDGQIRVLCCQDIGGDHQQLMSAETQHVGVTFKHLLLPVWLTSYRYRDRSYRVLINGQTGEVLVDRAYSFWKILSLVLVILALVAAIIFAAVKLSKSSRAERRKGDPVARSVLLTPPPNPLPEAERGRKTKELREGRANGGFLPPLRFG